MTKRMAVISFCDECPYFDDEYYDYAHAHTCLKLGRQIALTKLDPEAQLAGEDFARKQAYVPPGDCPLPVVS